jgi:hypothetical protein
LPPPPPPPPPTPAADVVPERTTSVTPAAIPIPQLPDVQLPDVQSNIMLYAAGAGVLGLIILVLLLR